MIHTQVYGFFQTCLPDQAKEVKEYFPNGKNSIRIRKTNGQEFIFSLREPKAWKFETIDQFLADLVNYAAKLQEEGYTNYTEHSKKNTEEKKDDTMPNEPYVISPDNYGENDNYTQISLVYYAGDGVLADDEDEVVEDIEATVGEDFAEHFGEYEDDSVFIRNDRLRCDYEILRDNRSFSDVVEGSNY